MEPEGALLHYKYQPAWPYPGPDRPTLLSNNIYPAILASVGAI